MKRTGLIALLLVAVLMLTACGGPKTFKDAKVEKLVTLGEYKGLTYTPVDASVSDYELGVALMKKISDSGYITEYEKEDAIKTGTVQIGDTCYIDFAGYKDGVAFAGGTAKGYELEIGSGSFIAGFEEGMVGINIGEEVSLDLTFPENYNKEELRGADVVFKVTVHYITKRVSALDDTIAAKIDSTVKTADELTAKIKKSLEDKKNASAQTTIKNELWAKVIEGCTFGKLPKNLVNGCAEEFEARYESLATQYKFESLDAFLAGQNISKENYEVGKAKYAENQVKKLLTAYAIAKAEGYTVTDTIRAEKLAEYGVSAGDFDPAVIHDQIILDFALGLVVENAKAAA